jgi:hypothetical protein
MNEGKMVWKQDLKSMGLGMHNDVQLYMRGRGHSVMICFPRKKLFLFQPTVRSDRNIDESKRLEV